MRLTRMNDNPGQIAFDLIEQHGVDGALQTVRDSIAVAHANGDNYQLSIWREVRRVLRDKLRNAGSEETPAA